MNFEEINLIEMVYNKASQKGIILHSEEYNNLSLLLIKATRHGEYKLDK